MILKIQYTDCSDFVFFESDKFFIHRTDVNDVKRIFSDQGKSESPIDNWFLFSQKSGAYPAYYCIIKIDNNDTVVVFELAYLLNNSGQTIERIGLTPR